MASTVERGPIVAQARLAPPELQVNPLVERLAHLMDEAIPIPGTSWRVGLDGIVGLVPVVGDLLGLVSAAVILQEAKRLKLPRYQQARIMLNFAIDTVLGAVPLVGDLFDFAFKANKASVEILRRHAQKLNRRWDVGNE
jgi:hypothetical protein